MKKTTSSWIKLNSKLTYTILLVSSITLFSFSIHNTKENSCPYGVCTVNLGPLSGPCKSCIYKEGAKTCFRHREYSQNDNSVKKSSSNKTTTSRPNLIFGMADIEQLISLSQLSESEYNNRFGKYSWSGWEYNEYISERGCLEKSWTKNYNGDLGLFSIEKCGEFVMMSTLATGMYEGMRDRPFTALGKELIPYRIGYDDGLTSYRVVKGARSYTIKVNWQYKFIIIMPEVK